MLWEILSTSAVLACVAGVERRRDEFVVDYFASRGVAAVTNAVCGREEDVGLLKEFSTRKIRFDCLDLKHLDEGEAVRRLTSANWNHGVFLDLGCPRGMDLLKMANEYDLFASGNSLTHWLVATRTHVSKERLEALSKAQKTKLGDPIGFLTRGYDHRKNEKKLLDINRRINWEFISSYQKPQRTAKGAKGLVANETEVDAILKMKILLEDIMALAVPGPDGSETLYSVYSVRRESAESGPKVEEIPPRRGRGGRLEWRREKRKRNLDGALLRATSAVLQPEAFTTIDDLATREADVWTKLSYPHIRQLAEDLNFRLITRFFDDYGWPKNGTFSKTTLMGFLQRKEAELSASVILIRPERMKVVNYMACPFRFETGILFREPPLSSVSNIFLLPFSKAIWISVGGAVVLTTVVLRCRIVAGRTLIPPDENVSDFFDVANYIVGAVCQQGFPTSPKSPSARATVLIVLLTSLALFTSYSACIVALLQSSSSAISTIEDITRSNLEVGIEINNPFYKVLVKDAAHPVTKEFYARKVLSQGEKAYYDRKDGIERMRTGLFAFEVELSAGYKLISETYQEREKCGIKEIDTVTMPITCWAVRRASPYKEAFAERLARQLETGLSDRSLKLWTDQKPKCEVGRIGFLSVGLIEFGPALQVYAYGIAAAALVFIAELFIRNKKAGDLLKRRPRGEPPKLFRRR